MEYSLRLVFRSSEGVRKAVLILILMEYSLRPQQEYC